MTNVVVKIGKRLVGDRSSVFLVGCNFHISLSLQVFFIFSSFFSTLVIITLEACKSSVIN